MLKATAWLHHLSRLQVNLSAVVVGTELLRIQSTLAHGSRSWRRHRLVSRSVSHHRDLGHDPGHHVDSQVADVVTGPVLVDIVSNRDGGGSHRAHSYRG